MKKYWFQIIFFSLTITNNAQTITDGDGNIYNTVTIGTQVWLKENLKTTKYNDGTNIPIVTSSSEWIGLTTPAYCWNSNNANYKGTYGALYNWYVINTGKLCPTNWHVPTDTDWATLISYLGGASVAGGKLKEAGTYHWGSPNQGADNSSGFTGLPGGFRDALDNGNFHNPGGDCLLWSSTEYNSIDTWGVLLAIMVSSSNLSNSFYKKNGCSVRCIKDINTSVYELDFFDDEIIYPNPVNDRFYLKNINLSGTKMMIFDMQGKLILNKEIVTSPLDISNLSKGVYIVKIYNSGVFIMNKLIKE